MYTFRGEEDPILNVRLIRDPQTFVGKGIGYVQFKDKDTMRRCIEKCNESRFMGRPLRIKKAVEPKRLEKKKRRTEERKEARDQQRKNAKEAAEGDDELLKLRNFEQAAYGDKDDEGTKKAPGIAAASKKIKKDKKEQSFEAHLNKIYNKSQKTVEDGEIDITNRLAFNKKKQEMVNKQKIEKGSSKFEDHKNKETFKD